jgi:DNA polymerase V
MGLGVMAKLFALVYCDNFFVSCERIFNPALEGKPIVVLSHPNGWVVARSPEAKAIGINPGIPIAQIEALIQAYDVTILTANSALYRDISDRMMLALQQFCPAIEIHNLDEAWLELAIAPDSNATIEPIITPQAISVSDYAQEIRRKLQQWLGIPLAIGIAPTKTLAKVATRLAQVSSAGIAALLTETEQNLALAATPVGEVWGIGSDYAQQLEVIGITNAQQLRDLPTSKVQQLFDPGMSRTIDELKGQIHFALQPETISRQAAIMFKTFGESVETIATLNEAAATYIAVLAQKLHNEALATTAISITLATNHPSNAPQYYNSTQIKLPYPTNNSTTLTKQAIAGLETIFMPGLRYQKLGITLAELIDINELELRVKLRGKLERPAQQRVNRLRQMVHRASAQMDTGWLRLGKDLSHLESAQAGRSQRYTTEWSELPIAKA